MQGIMVFWNKANVLKSVCPISVKSRRLSGNNAPRDRYTHAQKQCEKGLLHAENEIDSDVQEMLL